MELKNDTFVLDCYAEGYKVYARARALSPEVNSFEYSLCTSSGGWTPYNLEYTRVNGVFWAVLTPNPEKPGRYLLCVDAMGNNNNKISGMQVPFDLPAGQSEQKSTQNHNILPIVIGLVIVGVILWKLTSSTTKTASSTRSSASSSSSSRS